jgi:hypothetical protein
MAEEFWLSDGHGAAGAVIAQQAAPSAAGGRSLGDQRDHC